MPAEGLLHCCPDRCQTPPPADGSTIGCLLLRLPLALIPHPTLALDRTLADTLTLHNQLPSLPLVRLTRCRSAQHNGSDDGARRRRRCSDTTARTRAGAARGWETGSRASASPSGWCACCQHNGRSSLGGPSRSHPGAALSSRSSPSAIRGIMRPQRASRHLPPDSDMRPHQRVADFVHSQNTLT